MKTLWAVLLSLLLTAPVMAQEDDELTRKLERHVKVIRQMASNGAMDAYFHLALLAQIHVDETIFSAGDALHYMTIAASTGHPDSLRSLAFELLERGDIELRPEVATLLAEAAILGQSQAAVDLKLIPILTAITELEMVEGFNSALQRLAGSKAVDCDLLPPASCSEESAAVTRLRSKDVFYARALIVRGPYPNPAAVHRVFSSVLDGYTAFSDKSETPDKEELIKEQADKSDAAPELLFRRRDGAESAKAFLVQQLETDFEQHRERIELLLGLINGHRSAADQVSIDAIRSQMEVPGNE